MFKQTSETSAFLRRLSVNRSLAASNLHARNGRGLCVGSPSTIVARCAIERAAKRSRLQPRLGHRIVEGEPAGAARIGRFWVNRDALQKAVIAGLADAVRRAHRVVLRAARQGHTHHAIRMPTDVVACRVDDHVQTERQRPTEDRRPQVLSSIATAILEHRDPAPRQVFLTDFRADPDGPFAAPDDRERHGSPSVLNDDLRTSSLTQRPAARSAMVEMQRFDGVPPWVEAHDRPSFANLSCSDIRHKMHNRGAE